MKRLYSSVLFLAAALCMQAQANGQEDITSQYLTNPSFETDNIASLNAVTQSADGLRGYTLTAPNSWSVTGTDVTKLLITMDCYTDNNFGLTTTISDGEKAYYLRMGWSNGASSVKQTIKNFYL